MSQIRVPRGYKLVPMKLLLRPHDTGTGVMRPRTWSLGCSNPGLMSLKSRCDKAQTQGLLWLKYRSHEAQTRAQRDLSLGPVESLNLGSTRLKICPQSVKCGTHEAGYQIKRGLNPGPMRLEPRACDPRTWASRVSNPGPLRL